MTMRSKTASTQFDLLSIDELKTLIDRHHEELRMTLRKQLLAMDFHSFEAFIGQLLAAMGYQDVQVTDRTSDGGLDILASTQTGLTKALFIAQVKKYTYAVHRRFVDELRGTMLRVGAQQGLLITTSTFSEGARQAAENNHIAAVTLIDGIQLLDLIFEYQVGVRQETLQLWRLDQTLLEQLGKRTSADPGHSLSQEVQ